MQNEFEDEFSVSSQAPIKIRLSFVPTSIILWKGCRNTQVTRGYKEGKSVGACLGEHDGLNLTPDNRTFCGIPCTVSAHAAERTNTSHTDLNTRLSVAFYLQFAVASPPVNR